MPTTPDRLRLTDTRHKQFDDGVLQLEEEGLIQVFFPTRGGRDPIVGVVGILQFDVIASRLQSEYNVAARVEPMNSHAVCWVEGHKGDPEQLAGLNYTCVHAIDRDGRPVILFPSAWARQYATTENPGVTFADAPSVVSPALPG